MTKVSRLPLCFVIVFVMWFVFGCKNAPSVVGVWKGTLLGQDVTSDFKDDKTLSISMKDGEMGAVLSGTYTIDPKLLTITIADYKLKNVPDNLTDLGKKLFDPIKGKIYKLQYHFNSEDEIAVTYNKKTDSLKRQKDQ